MSELDDFAKRMDRIAVTVESNVERAVKDCAHAVTKSVVLTTPADTGKARSNWTAELDAAFSRLFPAHVPGTKGSTAEANADIAIDQASEVIERFDATANREIHIANSLPYIRALNDGHSKQAPAGFVEQAVKEGLATVRGAKILED